MLRVPASSFSLFFFLPDFTLFQSHIWLHFLLSICNQAHLMCWTTAASRPATVSAQSPCNPKARESSPLHHFRELRFITLIILIRVLCPPFESNFAFSSTNLCNWPITQISQEYWVLYISIISLVKITWICKFNLHGCVPAQRKGDNLSWKKMGKRLPYSSMLRPWNQVNKWDVQKEKIINLGLPEYLNLFL